MSRSAAQIGAALLIAGTLADLSGPAAAATPSPFANARLEGQFSMEARITVAKNIEGERVGEKLGRVWTFHPLCVTGPCAQVRLVRNRAGGADVLTLNQTTPGSYAGSGLFYAPLRCAGKTYVKGESVPFTIRVTITGASTTGIATSITANYTNRTRRNLTRCVQIPGHDAARYTGELSVAPSGGTGT